MHPMIRNILAIAAGIIIGGLINFGLIMIGYSIFPLEGLDPNDMESFKTAAVNMKTHHFIFPFLAHAIGTLVGAYVAARFAADRKTVCALIIGVFFLYGGIDAARIIPAPTWFVVADIALAYLPMAWLGGKWGSN